MTAMPADETIDMFLPPVPKAQKAPTPRASASAAGASALQPGQERIEGRLARLIFPRDPRDFDEAKGGWVLLSVERGNDKNNSINACGYTAVLPPIDSDLRLVGRWKDNPKYGRQFEFASLEMVLPSTRAGAERFLQTLHNIGPVRARAIVEALGDNAAQLILENPAVLEEHIGKRAVAAVESLRDKSATMATERQLCDLGFGPTTRKNILEHFGDRLPDILARNPYRLVEVDRVSFHAVDNALMALQRFPAHSPFRAAAATIQVLRDAATDGHTWLPVAEINARLDALKLAIPVPRDARSAGLAQAVATTAVVRVNGDQGAALTSLARAAELCAERLLAILKPAPDEKVDFDVSHVPVDLLAALTPEQRAPLDLLPTSGVIVITGGPGTGKTFTERALIPFLGRHRTLILAPTGKAARRANEVTGHPAMTIHRFAAGAWQEVPELECENDQSSRDPEGNPVPRPPRCLIVDEVSMVSIDVLAMLLGQLSRADHRLILIGDVDQLPSVGPGAVLRDLLASGIAPSIRLTKIHRQAAESTIIANAHRINRGEPISLAYKSERGDWYNLLHDERTGETAEQFAARVVARVVDAARHFDLDPVRDIAVLAPMRKGALGVERLNAQLRQALNPPAHGKRELPDRENRTGFRVGDKVLVTANTYDLGVVNGDVGRVQSVHAYDKNVRDAEGKIKPESVTVAFDDGRVVEFTGDNLFRLVQAWAMTIHKSQGSEYRMVFVVCARQHMIMLTRSLLYTAVTRASERVVLCGDQASVAIAIRKATANTRATLLDGLLRRKAAAAGGAIDQQAKQGQQGQQNQTHEEGPA